VTQIFHNGPPSHGGDRKTVNVMTKIVVCSFVLFPLAIVLSVLLRLTDSNYPFGIFRLFLRCIQILKYVVNENLKQFNDGV
jgi:hypothetical protein